MTSTEQVQTAGPVDPKAPGFAKFYVALAGVLGLVATAGAFGLISADQAASLKDLGYQIGVTAGSAVSAVAAFRTRKQLKNGTFNAAPEPETVEVPVHLPPLPIPADVKVEQGLSELKQNAEASMNAWTSATDKVTSLLGISLPPVVTDIIGAAEHAMAGAAALVDRS